MVIYDSYRPYDLQKLVGSSLSNLVNTNELVNQGVTKSPWSVGWFIATGVSMHQRGLAIDVSLAKIEDIEIKEMGDYSYIEVIEYDEYEMQSEMHELSVNSVSMKAPVNWKDEYSWQNTEPSDEMTDASLRLREYCTSARIHPISSEWWHFNDVETYEKLADKNNFLNSIKFEECISEAIIIKEN